MKVEFISSPLNRRLWLKLLLDAALFAAVFALSFYLRYELDTLQSKLVYLKDMILPVIVIKLAVFYFSQVYRISWRYASTMDFFRIVWANVLASIIVALLVYFFLRLPIARGVFALDGLLAVAATCGVRFAFRLGNKMRRQLFWQHRINPTLIIGAGDTGADIARQMLRDTRVKMQPVGFIDDDPSKRGMLINGIRVLGTRNQLADILTEYSISEVIICMPSAPRTVIGEIFTTCQNTGVKCLTLPGLHQLIGGTVKIEQIRNVQVEDILGREPVELDFQGLKHYVQNKKVMVTGAAGSIGAELCRQLNQLQPSALIIIDQDESGLFEIEQELIAQQKSHQITPIIADITSKARMSTIFKQYQPSIIFHSAAYKHVPMMETNLIEAVQNNVIGTKILCEEAIACRVEKFVLISTDKAVEPICNMGKTKAVAEKIVQYLNNNHHTEFIAVRFGNVLDSTGSVLPIFRKQIASGGPVSVTHPQMKRYFMTIPEAVHLIIRAMAMGKGGEIFVLDMGEQISILELAKSMVRLSGFEPDKDIPITITGIRPGEKLTEKLFWDDEDSLTTDNPRILATSNCSWDFIDFEQELMGLEDAVKKMDEQRLKEIIDKLCARRKQPGSK